MIGSRQSARQAGYTGQRIVKSNELQINLADPPFFCLREGDSGKVPKVPVLPVRDRGFKIRDSQVPHPSPDLSLCIRQIGPGAELSAMRTTIIIKMLPRKRWVFDIDIDCLINIIARSPEFWNALLHQLFCFEAVCSSIRCLPCNPSSPTTLQARTTITLLRSPTMSAGNQTPGPSTVNYNAIFEAAVTEYKAVTGHDLKTHAFSAAL